ENHDLGYLSPGYLVVWPERAVRVPGHHPGAVEEGHLSKVRAVLGYVREPQWAPAGGPAWRYARGLLVLVVAVVAPRLVKRELNPRRTDVLREVVAEVTAHHCIARWEVGVVDGELHA